MSKPSTISIDGTEYVRKDSISQPAVNAKGLPYVVIRSRDSGCHAGYLKEEHNSDPSGPRVVLVNARRLWYWDGAATLSQLSQEGVTNPKDCKFPAAIPEITVYSICEKIPASQKAQASIEGVPVWKR